MFIFGIYLASQLVIAILCHLMFLRLFHPLVLLLCTLLSLHYNHSAGFSGVIIYYFDHCRAYGPQPRSELLVLGTVHI